MDSRSHVDNQSQEPDSEEVAFDPSAYYTNNYGNDFNDNNHKGNYKNKYINILI